MASGELDPPVSTVATPGRALDSLDDPPPGTTIGHFVIESRIGEGGMGVVFRARDLVLERGVAVKLVRPGREDEAEARRVRLLREAQAMAKLVHPNVLTVYEAGIFGGEVYLAMEHVAGGTLRGWLDETPRGRAEILRMFVAAGRGLGAAHAGGLIHRDFKPSNVLVGDDGRPRVMDFGLVGGTSGKADGGLELTQDGEVMGTPRYMAPEQHLGETVDARADQFAFAASLYEALVGHPPFAGTTIDEVKANVVAERLLPGAERLPRRLAQALERALRRDPAARWPSMDALLAVLSAPPLLTLPRVLIGLALAGGTAALVVLGVRGRGEEPCGGAAQRLAGVWDAPARAAVRAKLPGADAAGRVERAFDAYAAQWTAMHTEACRATAVRHEQSDATLDLRMRCLDQRLAGLRALTQVLAQGGVKEDRAVDAALRLDRVADCGDLAILRASAPPPPSEHRAEADALRARLAEANAHLQVADMGGAQKLGLPLEAEARRLDYPPLLAEALLMKSRMVSDKDPKQAEAALVEAIALAGELHDDLLAARTQLGLLDLLGNVQDRLNEALALRPLVDAALRRAGDPPGLRGRFLLTLGRIFTESARNDEALAALDAALPVYDRAYGERSVGAGHVHESLARVYDVIRKGDEAQRQAELARAIYAERLGEESTDVGSAHNLMGIMANRRGDVEGARAQFEKSLRIIEHNFGETSARAATTRYNLGRLALTLGRNDEARAYLERSLAIREQVLGPVHPEVAVSLFMVGELDLKEGKLDAAGARLERALAIQEKTLPADHINLSYTLDRLADLRKRAGKTDEALALVQRSYAIRSKRLGAANPVTLQTVAWEAQIYLEAGRPAEALRLLEPAEKALTDATDAEARVSVLYELARAVRGSGGDPARARALATRARDVLLASKGRDLHDDETLRKLDQFLAGKKI